MYSHKHTFIEYFLFRKHHDKMKPNVKLRRPIYRGKMKGAYYFSNKTCMGKYIPQLSGSTHWACLSSLWVLSMLGYKQTFLSCLFSLSLLLPYFPEIESLTKPGARLAASKPTWIHLSLFPVALELQLQLPSLIF